MGKDLIIVESPAKVKTIKKFLGPQYMVQASVGHVRDLPSSSLGVDEANDFAPQYEIIDNKKNVVSELRSAAAKADTVYLAPDPDREGEAIAWHVAELIRDKAKDIKRIQFNEITARAVKEALAHPRELNQHLFDAQQARRVLDRLVGYKISPLLWKTIKRGISAGRVQSVALRLIVEREAERAAFKPEEYWLFKALLGAEVPPSVRAELARIGGKKAVIRNAEEANALEAELKGQPFVVESVEQKKRERAPQPPFITSTLQQAANQRLSYTAKRTMNIAQRLYEGVEMEDGSITALITYMRTDSTRIADEARQAAHDFIQREFGNDYLPAKKRVYKTKSGAQDAHEAIRPVDVNITPEMVKAAPGPVQPVPPDLVALRGLADGRGPLPRHHGDRGLRPYPVEGQGRAPALSRLFGRAAPRQGRRRCRAAAPGGRPDPEAGEAGQGTEVHPAPGPLQRSQPGARTGRAGHRPPLHLRQHHLHPAGPRIRAPAGPPLIPTDLGRVVCEQLVQHFPHLMDVGFTAEMESLLDKVADGDQQWVDLMHAFAADFNPTLAAAAKNMQSVKGGLPTDLACPDCGKPLMIKFGKAGPFLACSGYPDCRFTSNFQRTEDGRLEIVAPQKPELEKVGECPRCGKDLVIKHARTGSRFIACTGYPDCNYTAPMATGVMCPRCGEGRMVEKSTKRGKLFYSCDRYPQCDFALWDKPVPGPCPRCNSSYLVEKRGRDGSVKIMCPTKGCGYVKGGDDGQDA